MHEKYRFLLFPSKKSENLCKGGVADVEVGRWVLAKTHEPISPDSYT